MRKIYKKKFLSQLGDFVFSLKVIIQGAACIQNRHSTCSNCLKVQNNSKQPERGYLFENKTFYSKFGKDQKVLRHPEGSESSESRSLKFLIFEVPTLEPRQKLIFQLHQDTSKLELPTELEAFN